MIPVISIYNGLGVGREGKVGRSPLGSSIFLAGYLSLYALLGLGLFGAVYLVFQAGALLPWLSQYGLYGVAAVLLLAGAWQLSPLKEKSLAKCVSPVGFFMTHSKKGKTGALRMGAEHGAYCVACCWLYMLVMLAVAAMSLVSMVILSGIIIVEKAFVGRRPWFRWLSAGIFFSLAALALAYPASLALGL
jgi:predicted metal-binding membrane protein